MYFKMLAFFVATCFFTYKGHKMMQERLN